jgi:hypothetical protein
LEEKILYINDIFELNVKELNESFSEILLNNLYIPIINQKAHLNNENNLPLGPSVIFTINKIRYLITPYCLFSNFYRVLILLMKY